MMNLDDYVLTKKIAKEFAPVALTPEQLYSRYLGYTLVIAHRNPAAGVGVGDTYTDDVFGGIITGSAPFPASQYSTFGAANTAFTRTSFAIGFSFPFEFSNYDYVFVNSNGWLQLTDGASSIPSVSTVTPSYAATPEGPRLFPWHDDLTMARSTEGGGVFVRSFVDPEDGLKTFCTRWTAWATYTSDTAILNFECWLKPTGEIQYRYSPKRNFSGASSAAAIGTIISTTKYRDFTTNIELRGGSRTVTRVNAQLDRDWPGSDNAGAVLKFRPKSPTNSNGPRVRIRDADIERYLPDAGEFDDRITIIEKPQNVSFPTLLPVRYADTTRLADGAVDVTTTITSTLSPRTYTSDGWIGRRRSSTKPFSEHIWLGDTGDASTISSGTRYQTASPEPVPVSGPTSSERCITFSIPVASSSAMLAQAPDLLYYNSQTQRFDSIGPAGVYRTPGFEDYKLFGPFGVIQFSGSLYQPTVGQIAVQPNKEFTKASSYLMSNVISGSNPLNIAEFKHDTNSCIEYTGTEPIIVDKVSFSIPIKAGPGWFSDKTRFVEAQNYRSVGGPAVTFALIRQRDETARDLIASGTIIPTQDNILTSSIYPGPQDLITYHPIGYRQFGYPTVVVASSSNGYYTGSIQSTVKATKTTGFLLAGQAVEYSRDAEAYAAIPHGHRYDGSVSPRSLFTAITSPTTQSLDSAFDYVGVHGYDTAAVAAAAYGVDPFAVFYTQFQNFTKTVETPYIVYPGDKFIIALAKHRPWFGAETTWQTADIVHITGSHDISVNVGQGIVQLHGYTLTAGNQREFFPVTEQDQTPAIRVTDASPPSDIFLLDRSDAYIGSVFDSQFSGSLVTKLASSTRAVQLVTGTRDYAGSRIRSSENSFDFTKVSSDRYIPRYETCGFEKFFTSVSDDECIYDSLPPNPIDILKLSGQYSVDPIEHKLGNVGQLRGFTTSSFAAKYYQYVSIHGYDGIRRWDRAFPFEPYYANAQRINGAIGFEKLIDADHSASLTSFSSITFGVPRTPTSLATLGWAEMVTVAIDGVTPLSSSFKSNAGVYGGLMLLAEPTEFTPLNGFRSSSIAMPPENVYMAHMYGIGDTAPSLIDDQYAYTGSMSYKDSSGTTIHGGFSVTKRLLNAPSFRKVIPYMYNDSTRPCGWKTIDNEGITNVNPLSFSFGTNDGVPTVIGYGAVLRGYRYGLAGIQARQSTAIFSSRNFGMMRDMLEQRQDTKFVSKRGRTQIKSAPVSVRFVSIDSGTDVEPALTDSSNLSTEATSSLPFFDNTSRNRPELVKETLKNANLKITLQGKNTKNLSL